MARAGLPQDQPSGWSRFALLSCLLAAFLLRVAFLDRQDIWGDEAGSIFRSFQPLPSVLLTTMETHPPLYSLLLTAWIPLTGHLSFSIRFPSVVAGVVGVVLLWSLGRRLFGQPTALLAAGLLAVSPVAVYYSQEARMYIFTMDIMLACAAVTAKWFGLSAAGPPMQSATYSPRANSPIRTALAWITLGLAGYLTHYFAVFVSAALNLSWLLLVWRRATPRWSWLATQAAYAVLGVAWMASQLEFLTGRAREGDDPPGLSAILSAVPETVASFVVGVTPPANLGPWPVAVALALSAIGLAGWPVDRRPPSNDDGQPAIGKATWPARLFLAPLVIVPLVLGALAVVILPFYHPRYLLVALPYFLLAVARGAVVSAGALVWLGGLLTGGRANRPAVAGVLTVLLALGVLAPLGGGAYRSLTRYYLDPTTLKSGYGAMMRYVQQQMQPGDALLLNNQLQETIYAVYEVPGLPVYWFPPEQPWNDPATQGELDEIAGKYRRLWLVMYGDPAEYDAGHDLERLLARRAFRTYREGFIDAELSLYLLAAGAGEERLVRAQLGPSIRLQSYRLVSDQLRPGDGLYVTLSWQAIAPVDRAYTVFTHLVGETVNPATNNRVWAQFDGEPQGGALPTNRWRPGQTVEDRIGLRLPDNLPPGVYELEVGMYALPSVERLPVRLENGDLAPRLVLATVTVGK